VGEPYDKMAPAFMIAINGEKFGVDISSLVQSVEYESSDGIADEARVTFGNPDYQLCGSPLWQPGNQMDIWFGYGTELGFIGRVIIMKPNPKFVRDGMPTIEIQGYTKDRLMAENKPNWKKKDIRNFQTDIISDAVERIASQPEYSFDTLDIDPTPNKYAPPQKADMADYNFVRGMANALGWTFWVDYSIIDRWTLHFKDPENIHQERIYTFEHHNGQNSTLLDFDPELSLSGSATRLQIQSRDPDSGKLYVEEFNDEQTVVDGRYNGDPGRKLEQSYSTGGAVIKYFFGDYAVEVVSDKTFKSASDMRIWAEAYWKKKREDFITGRGTLIGVEDLRARQTHTLIVPDKTISGEYYFMRARHQMSVESGYLIDFTARKIVK